MIRYYAKLLINNTPYMEILSLMVVLGLLFTGMTLSDGAFQASQLPDTLYLPFFFNPLQGTLLFMFQFALALLMAIPYGKLSSIERRVMPLLLSRHKRRTLLLSRSIVVFLSCALLLIACEGSSLLCADISVGHTDFHSYASYIVPSNDYLIQITTPFAMMVYNQPSQATLFYMTYSAIIFGLLGLFTYHLGKLVAQVRLTYIFAFLFLLINFLFTNDFMSLADVMHPFTYSGESLLKNVPFLMVIYFILLLGGSLIVYYKSYHSITP
ncbi:hypothetical protein [Intestinibaculum porci]|uniref:hypothetical protein n=1 Tax=Intestinibaculum porci TaxID=2487118 RepID=UPI0024095CD6|nr:hypothetical protein [Intestinibaculum porci]MDD6350703.1 hypothetical protein [Intestinibaculum porci]MDD6422325.1 hypothetical protein [Intestinibaculum porci]